MDKKDIACLPDGRDDDCYIVEARTTADLQQSAVGQEDVVRESTVVPEMAPMPTLVHIHESDYEVDLRCHDGHRRGVTILQSGRIFGCYFRQRYFQSVEACHDMYRNYLQLSKVRDRIPLLAGKRLGVEYMGNSHGHVLLNVFASMRVSKSDVEEAQRRFPGEFTTTFPKLIREKRKNLTRTRRTQQSLIRPHSRHQRAKDHTCYKYRIISRYVDDLVIRIGSYADYRKFYNRKYGVTRMWFK